MQKNPTGHLTPTKVPRIKRKNVRKASTFRFRILNPREAVTLRKLFGETDIYKNQEREPSVKMW